MRSDLVTQGRPNHQLLAAPFLIAQITIYGAATRIVSTRFLLALGAARAINSDSAPAPLHPCKSATHSSQ